MLPLKTFHIIHDRRQLLYLCISKYPDIFSMTAFTSSQKGGNSQQIGEFRNDVFSIYIV